MPTQYTTKVTNIRKETIMQTVNPTTATTTSPSPSGLRVKSTLKAGGMNMQHNQTLVCISKSTAGAKRA